jgi:hypothetical protein
MSHVPGHLQFPTSSSITDEAGNLTPVWRAYFERLYIRTGGAEPPPVDTASLVTALAAERIARIAADNALQAALTIETTQRIAADNAETAARIAGDNALTQALDTERAARIASDALLVPIAQLCSMWAQCNLLFLPPSDPGSGRPWLDPAFPAPGHIAVGTSSAAVVGMLLEDASGDWEIEAGTGHWIWG